MKRKIVSMSLTFLMAASCLIGCKGGEKSSAFNSSKSNGDVIELSFYNADGQEDPWTDPVAQVLTEKTGVKLATDYPVSSDDQKIALMIAENNYPDMIYAKGDVQSLIDAGALIDMTELIDKYGENIKKMYGDEFEKLKYSKDDPAIYQLSSYSIGGTNYKTSGPAQVQWQVLKENDYKLPKDIYEYEQMIKDFIAKHPKTDDGLDYIGFSISASDWHWMITLGNPAGAIADCAPDNGQWIIDKDNNVSYKFKSEKEKEYFRWLNKLYNEGLLDPECATQTHEDYIAKIASGRVLGLFDKDWDYGDGEKVLIADGKVDHSYAPIPLVMDENTKCPELQYQGLVTGQGVGISTSCKDPVAAIKFLDYICSEEGQILVNWGIEGKNYTVENGKRVRSSKEIQESKTNKDYSKTTGVGFHAYPFPCHGNGIEDSTGNTFGTDSKENVIAEYNEEQKAACKAWNVELLTEIFPSQDQFEIPKYSPVWAYTMPQEVSEIQTKLDEYAQAQLIVCVIGKEKDFDANYDKMLKEFKNMGEEKAEKLVSDIIKERVAIVE